MKRLLLVCLLTLIFTTPSVVNAVDLGKGFKVDGYATVGKLWDVDFSDTDRTRHIDITTNKGEVYLEAEAGLRYSMFRAFGKYQYVGGVMQDEVFSLETLGMDILPLDKVSAGVRVSYNWLRVPNLIQRDFAYTGLIFKW